MNAKNWKLSRGVTYEKENGKLFFDRRRYVVMGADILVSLQEEMEKIVGPSANTLFYDSGYEDQYIELKGIMEKDMLMRMIAKTGWGRQKIIGEVIENLMKHQGWGMAAVMEYPNKDKKTPGRLRFFSTVFTLHHKRGRFPVCGYLVGSAGGIASVLYGERMEAVEKRCKCMGEPNCEVEVTFEGGKPLE